MADVLVKKAAVKEGRIASLDIGLYGLPDRTIDRDTAISWMRDGHSMIPVRGGKRMTALQLVEVGDEDEPFIRHDNSPVAEDSVPL